MKILHVSSGNVYGGASKAAIELHKSLIDQNIDSYFLSQQENKSIYNSIGKNSSFQNVIDIIKNAVARKISKFYKSKKKETLSISYFNSETLKKINNFECDLVNLHWICNEFISIEQIKKINKPIIWSLYDMWPFSGAEHYSEDNRFKDGYLNSNRNNDEKGFDLNRWVWKKKLNNFQFPLTLVSPSEWLKQRAKESVIFKNREILKIGHPINTDFWKPSNKVESKKYFNFSENKKLILFLSSGISQNYRKGMDLFIEAIKKTKIKKEKFEIVILGQKKISNIFDKDINVKNINYLYDDFSRKLLYDAADLLISPSRTEAFNLAVAETGSCEVPSVGFENTGLEEIILHKESGYLSKKNDTNELARGIEWFFEEEKRFSQLGKKAREHIQLNFNRSLITKKYIDLYNKIIDIN